MVSHRRTLLVCIASFLALVAACDKVPLLAPTGTVITLILSTTSVSLNSEVTIVATVIENGTAPGGTSGGTGSRPGAGTPVQNGTVITFTTTIGTIEPAEARTHNGQVTVKLRTGSTSGTAVINAYSGGASATLNTLKVGSAAVATLLLTTNPSTLGVSGGSVQVLATVTDPGGNGVGGVPVTFTTDRGTISPSRVTTDNSGTAAAVLTTNATAKVFAVVSGVEVVDATVTVSARSLTSFTASNASPPTVGQQVNFQVTAVAGNTANVHIDFGDGSSADLGAIAGQQTVPHAYSSPGIYTATATVPGESGLSTQVSVGSLPVTIDASDSTPNVNEIVTFTVGGVGSAQVQRYVFNFDDGTPPAQTTSPRTTKSFTSVGQKTIRVDVFGVGGGQIGTATVRINVIP